MKPKSIIIKTNTDSFSEQLVNELSEYSNIRFFARKMNGENTIVIKCYNYYDKYKEENTKKFYGNYNYLYTCFSLILTDAIITNYEATLVNRILKYHYFYFEKAKLHKIANIVHFLLNPNSPLEKSHELLLYRKQIILAILLQHFHKTNYIQLDSFINFSLTNYYLFLEEIVEAIISLYVSDLVSIEYLNFVIKNIFE